MDSIRTTQLIRVLGRRDKENRRLEAIQAVLLDTNQSSLPKPEEMTEEELEKEFQQYHAISNTPFMTRELSARWLSLSAEHIRRTTADFLEV